MPFFEFDLHHHYAMVLCPESAITALKAALNNTNSSSSSRRRRRSLLLADVNAANSTVGKNASEEIALAARVDGGVNAFGCPAGQRKCRDGSYVVRVMNVTAGGCLFTQHVSAHLEA